jgi:hypothetical protein
VRPNVGVGGSVKYLRSTLGDDEASSYAVDVGVLYSLSEAATLGAAARNLGPGVTFIEDSDPLPAVVAVGGSYSWKDLVVALDVETQNDLSVGARLGVEYSPIRHLALRGGVISGEDSALSPFVGGVGVTLDDSWALDYAYRPSDLGGTQWLAVSGRFGSAPAVLAAAGEDEPQVIETLVPRSNLAVITDLTTEVVNEALLAMRVPEGSEIYLKQVDQHGASWLVQSILLEELTGRGHVVKTGTMSAGASETEERSSFEISYRIVGCGTTYPRAWREWLVGTRKVERRTSVDIYFQLSDESKAVIWAGSAQRERRDIISGARLAELSTPGQPFTSPEMEFGGWDKVLEPLVVAGIIGGLIYLFYTSKSTD